MKWIVEKILFEDALEDVSTAFPARTTLPILENVLIRAKEGALTLTATNLELSAQRTIKADIQEEGEITLPGKQFKSIVSYFPDAPVEAKLIQGGLEVRSTRGRYTFMTMAPEDFPAVENLESNSEVSIQSEKLARGLEKVIFCAARGDPRPYLNGILFEFFDKGLKLVASDSHKLGMFSFECSHTIGEEMIIVSPKIYDLIRRKMGEELKLTIKENVMNITFKDGFFVVRLINEKYPAYQNVIPKEAPNVLQCPKKDINDALKRLIPFSPEPNFPIRFSLSSTVTLSTQSPELGEAQEELPSDYQGEEMDIGFNARYLQDIVKAIDEETVVLKFTESEKASIIEPFENREYSYLLMPVRL